MFFMYLLSAILGAAAAILTLQNPDPVVVNFLRWRSVSLPLSLVIMRAVFLGIVVASVIAFTQETQLRRRISRFKLHMGELRRQIAELSDIAHLPRGLPSARAETAPRDQQRVPVMAEHGHRA
jgi:uncharacterized integral membrane protein